MKSNIKTYKLKVVKVGFQQLLAVLPPHLPPQKKEKKLEIEKASK